jgi:hypothetical protein
MFLENKNVADINGRLQLRGTNRITSDHLAAWYESYMLRHDMRSSEFDNVISMFYLLTDQYVREQRGINGPNSEEVPYMPAFSGNAYNPADTSRTVQTRKDGKYPAYRIESAVEDMPDATGQPVVRNRHNPIRMFLPPRPWRFGQPISIEGQQAGRIGSHLIDRSDIGSLQSRELLSRKHTPWDMSIFMTDEPTHRGGRGGRAALVPNHHQPWHYE